MYFFSANCYFEAFLGQIFEIHHPSNWEQSRKTRLWKVIVWKKKTVKEQTSKKKNKVHSIWDNDNTGKKHNTEKENKGIWILLLSGS